MARLLQLWRQVRWSVRQRGARGTVAVVFRRLARRQNESANPSHPFDVANGVDTSGLIGGGRLGDGHPNTRFATAYYGVQPSRLRAALAKWRDTPGTGASERYLFLDLGAGKGRAMLIASEIGFREIAGIELDGGLVKRGRQNLALWRQKGRANTPMSLVQSDVTEAPLPEGPLLVYLYNPFHAPVLERVLQRLQSMPGENVVDILYMVPEQAEAFAGFSRFTLLWSEVFDMSEEDRIADLVSHSDERCNLYRLTAPAQS